MKHNKIISKNNYVNALFPESFSSLGLEKQNDRQRKAVTEANQQTKFNYSEKSFMVARKAKIYKKEHSILKERQENISQDQKISNFDKLKNQIKHLQNSQFLSFKLQSQEKTQIHDRGQTPSEYRINKQFMSTKKISVFQRYKQTLKHHHKKIRRASNLLNFKSVQNNITVDFPSFSSIRLADFADEPARNEAILKKKQTPNIVKKYYRPQSSSLKSIDSITIGQNEVRGRKLKSSQSTRKQKQNLVIMCF